MTFLRYIDGRLSVNSHPLATDEKRRQNMRKIRSKNTSIEEKLRKALWHSGIRYRKNYSKLPGSPDIVLLRHKIVIFCDGEFWHGKDWNNKKGKIRANREYWIKKIERNMMRDMETNRWLHYHGWTVLRFWGEDINKDINGCLSDIKDAIFQREIDRYNSTVCDKYYGDEWSGECV